MSASSTCESVPLPIVNIAAYLFVTLGDLPERRERLRTLCKTLGLKGTILLSPEGINLFIAGEPAAVDGLLAEFHADPKLCDLEVKQSMSDHQPFSRMLVKIKKEIIAFGIPGIDPAKATSKRISAEELKAWFDEKRPFTLLDTRNDYEFSLGTFEGAMPIGVDSFRDFPAAVDRLPESMKQESIVTFCTGGIRCEKAAPYLERCGYRDVYQLDGGILKYFELCGQQHFRGECFVFDKRVAVDGDLLETDTALCFACQRTLSVEDQASEHYVAGESCSYCIENTEN